VVVVSPLEAGRRVLKFTVNKTVGGSIPKKFINSRCRPVSKRTGNWRAAGYPMVDLRVTVVVARTMTLTRQKWRLKIAGSMSLKLRKANPVVKSRS